MQRYPHIQRENNCCCNHFNNVNYYNSFNGYNDDCLNYENSFEPNYNNHCFDNQHKNNCYKPDFDNNKCNKPDYDHKPQQKRSCCFCNLFCWCK